jgi:holin-like protein
LVHVASHFILRTEGYFTMRKLAIGLRHFIRRSLFAQIGLLVAFWLLGETLAQVSRLPVPGGIVGLLIVLGLLASGHLSIISMRRGAERLLADMLLFFVPAALAVVTHRELLGLLGLKILAVICVGTLIVMAVTAVTVDIFYRWRLAHVAGKAAGHVAADRR